MGGVVLPLGDCLPPVFDSSFVSQSAPSPFSFMRKFDIAHIDMDTARIPLPLWCQGYNKRSSIGPHRRSLDNIPLSSHTYMVPPYHRTCSNNLHISCRSNILLASNLWFHILDQPIFFLRTFCNHRVSPSYPRATDTQRNLPSKLIERCLG